MTQSGELFEVVTDYPGKPGDAQFLPVSKGEIVRVIKQESEWFTIEKKGKVPRSNLRPYTSTTSVSQIHSISTSQKYLKSQNSTSQPLNVTKSSLTIAVKSKSKVISSSVNKVKSNAKQSSSSKKLLEQTQPLQISDIKYQKTSLSISNSYSQLDKTQNKNKQNTSNQNKSSSQSVLQTANFESFSSDKPTKELNNTSSSSSNLTTQSPNIESKSQQLEKEDKISSARSSIVQYPVDIKASSSTSSSLYHAPKFEEFDIRRKLEGGVMGRTYLVRLKESNNFFVMKRVDYLTKDDKDAAEEEVAQLRRLSSQYTVKLLWAFTRDSDLCLIQEFCSGGDLRNTIKELQKIPEIERVDVDIKPANIFIMEDGTARLGDFGLAKNLKEDSNATVAGTRFYRPPESFMWQKMSYSADIFALGVVICELLIGKHPFLAETELETIMNIRNAKLSKLPDWIPTEMKNIVMKMINSDPLKRPSTQELMENENIKRLIETQEQRLNDQNQKRYADIFELPTGQHVYNDFDIFDELNGGYFGRVLLVRLKNSGQIYLMKRLPYMKQDDKHKADDEIVVLKQLQSKYTVRLFEAFPFDIDICLIEEYYQKGDMRRKIYEIQKLSNEERIKICLKFMYQILMGVNMLHSKNIIHRDIKPENIYIDNNGNAILGDFGLAKNIGSHSYVKVAGTELYTAPEAFLQDKMFLESDIFSAGITFFEMLTGNHPFKKDEYENFETTLKKIKNGQSDQLPDWVPVDLKRIVMNMIHVDYERRPSAEQILNSNLMKIQVEIENANQ